MTSTTCLDGQFLTALPDHVTARNSREGCDSPPVVLEPTSEACLFQVFFGGSTRFIRINWYN
jgi:hypothetical protein